LTPSAGTLHSDQDLIFATEIGRLLDASNINQRSFKALLLYVGLRPIRFDGLRHTCATLLLTRGVHPRSFKELLGHCTIAIILDTCSHVLLDVQDHTTRALEDALS
jgi:integrase